MGARDRREEQFIHLVRLAWELHKRGLSTAIDLPNRDVPKLLFPGAATPLPVMALAFDGKWFFSWGRGRRHRVRALAEDAADRVWEATQ